MMHRLGFTLVEVLVTVAVLLALSMMASGVYMGYVHTGEEAVVRNNLNTMRGALQQFYLDNGRYPYRDLDHYANKVGFLDDATSELVQGPHKAPGKYPTRRNRYLNEIPIDPSTNSKGWTMATEPFRVTESAAPLFVVTGVSSANPLFKHL